PKERMMVIASNISRTNNLPAVIQGMGHTVSASECPQVGHGAIAVDKGMCHAEISRKTHDVPGGIDPAGNAPVAESVYFGHLSAVVDKCVFDAAVRCRHASHLPGRIDGGRDASLAFSLRGQRAKVVHLAITVQEGMAQVGSWQAGDADYFPLIV